MMSSYYRVEFNFVIHIVCLTILSKHTIRILFRIIALQWFQIKKIESSTRYNNQNKARDIPGEKETWKALFKIRQFSLTKEK